VGKGGMCGRSPLLSGFSGRLQKPPIGFLQQENPWHARQKTLFFDGLKGYSFQRIPLKKPQETFIRFAGVCQRVKWRRGWELECAVF
jgi:hypothetical protein